MMGELISKRAEALDVILPSPSPVPVQSRAGVNAGGPRSSVAIRVDSLAFTVGDARRKGKATEILAGVDLAVHEHEFVSIVGPSGCGKSTVLNFIAGLLPVQSGTVTLAGSPRNGRTLGYVFQQHGLLPWRTVLENVELGLEVAGVAAAERRSQALDMLAQMGLNGFENHYPKEISGGMRQRVALARTLVTHPEIILMDEPFGALDAQTRVFIQEMFSNFWEGHRKTVLFVTHDIAEALLLSDRIVVMGARPGRIIAEYRVDIDRPRSFDGVHHHPRFQALHDRIWNDIKAQALLSMRGNV